jgi:hypothetical protein
MHDEYIPNWTVIAATRGIGKSNIMLNYILWMLKVRDDGCLMISDKTLLKGNSNEKGNLYELPEHAECFNQGSFGNLLVG